MRRRDTLLSASFKQSTRKSVKQTSKHNNNTPNKNTQQKRETTIEGSREKSVCGKW